MRYTMRMAEHALSSFTVETQIIDGRRRLSGLRIGSEPGDWISLEVRSPDVACRSGDDVILVRNASLAQVADKLYCAFCAWADWELKLEKLIFQGSLQDIVEASTPVFQNPVFVVDKLDSACAHSAYGPGAVNDEWDYMLTNGRMPMRRTAAIFKDPAFSRLGSKAGMPFIFGPPGMYHRGINGMIYDSNSGEFVGNVIIIENETPLTIGMVQLAETFLNAISRWVEQHKDSHALRSMNDIFVELIEKKPVSDEEIASIRSLMGYNGCHFVLVVIRHDGKQPPLFATAHVEKAAPGCRCFEYDNSLLALCPVADGPEQVKALCKALGPVSEQTDRYMGVSFRFSDWRDLPSCYMQACIAVDYGKTRVNFLSSQSAMSYALSRLKSDLLGANITHPALNELRRYDKRYGTDYYTTLYVYLSNERRLNQTAEALFVHRNSLRHRIERIESIISGLGSDLEDQDERTYLLLSYKLDGLE